MAREIYHALLDGVSLRVVVPDNASREDEIDIIVHHIKYYKDKANTIRAALEAIKELAEEDENVKALLEEEQFEKAIEWRAQAYEAMALDLVRFLTRYATAEELASLVVPALFTAALIKSTVSKVVDGLIQKMEEKAKENNKYKWAEKKPDEEIYSGTSDSTAILGDEDGEDTERGA